VVAARPVDSDAIEQEKMKKKKLDEKNKKIKNDYT